VKDFLAQLHMLAQREVDDWINLLILAAMAVFSVLGGLIKGAAKKKSQQTQGIGSAKAQRQQGESWQQRLARKAEELQQAVEAKSTEATERMRRLEERARLREQAKEFRPARSPVSGPPKQPRPGTISVHTGRRGESILAYEQAEPPAVGMREQHAARQREAREAVAAAGHQARIQPSPVEPRAGTGGLGFEPAVNGSTGAILEPAIPTEPDAGKLEALPGPVGYEPASIIDYADPDALKKAILHYEILGKPLSLRDSSERAMAF
jgi:hypothetical protein